MNMRLLIVDDDLPFRERLSRSMEKKGFDVESSPGFKDSILKVNEGSEKGLFVYSIIYLSIIFWLAYKLKLEIILGV